MTMQTFRLLVFLVMLDCSMSVNADEFEQRELRAGYDQ
jgi:hypothetical protein